MTNEWFMKLTPEEMKMQLTAIVEKYPSLSLNEETKVYVNTTCGRSLESKNERHRTKGSLSRRERRINERKTQKK